MGGSGRPTVARPGGEPVRAVTRDADGNLKLEYKLNGNPRPGYQDHDENVGTWSDRDVEKLVRRLLDIDAGDPVKIEIGDE